MSAASPLPKSTTSQEDELHIEEDHIRRLPQSVRITSVLVHLVKLPRPRQLDGEDATSLRGTDYIRVGGYRHIDPRRWNATVVEIRTDVGLAGWGESQSPIGAEVVGSIIQRILAPLLLGQDPLLGGVLRSQMYEALRVRGQTTGFFLDAIAGLDGALWDLKARFHDLSIARLAGGPFRTELAAYVSGLSKIHRVEEAATWSERGFGVKAGLRGLGPDDMTEVRLLREAVGATGSLYIDGMWQCSAADAVRVARVLQESSVRFFEAPLDPEDVDGHAWLGRHVDVPIAVGEPLRTRYQFLPWLTKRAMSIAQPDLMRVGPTEALAIASLAETFHIPIAFHCGVATPIGMATTWQVASAVPNFYVQEFQPAMRDSLRDLCLDPLDDHQGRLVVPDRPGIGVTIDSKVLKSITDGTIEIRD